MSSQALEIVTKILFFLTRHTKTVVQDYFFSYSIVYIAIFHGCNTTILKTKIVGTHKIRLNEVN